MRSYKVTEYRDMWAISINGVQIRRITTEDGAHCYCVIAELFGVLAADTLQAPAPVEEVPNAID